MLKRELRLLMCVEDEVVDDIAELGGQLEEAASRLQVDLWVQCKVGQVCERQPVTLSSTGLGPGYGRRIHDSLRRHRAVTGVVRVACAEQIHCTVESGLGNSVGECIGTVTSKGCRGLWRELVNLMSNCSVDVRGRSDRPPQGCALAVTFAPISYLRRSHSSRQDSTSAHRDYVVHVGLPSAPSYGHARRSGGNHRCCLSSELESRKMEKPRRPHLASAYRGKG